MSKNTRQQWKDKSQGQQEPQPDLAAGGPISGHPGHEPDPVEVVRPLDPAAKLTPPDVAEAKLRELAAAVPPLAKDGAIAANPDALQAPKPDAKGISKGQVWVDVVVPDRPINKMGLRPGARLNPLEIETPYGDGRWMACFVGERATKIEVDAEMLKTGKLRA